MADNPSIPTGAVPPKKETGKVQPKKETVRINLPPKPSAAPTIKLPTLPPGGPTGAAGVTPLPSATKSAPIAAPAMQSRAASAPVAQQQRPSSLTTQRPAAAAPTIGGLDRSLAILAAIAGVAALAVTAYLVWMLPIGN
jgi:hypothetical protein